MKKLVIDIVIIVILSIIYLATVERYKEIEVEAECSELYTEGKIPDKCKEVLKKYGVE